MRQRRWMDFLKKVYLRERFKDMNLGVDLTTRISSCGRVTINNEFLQMMKDK